MPFKFLPRMAPYPEQAWIDRILPDEWAASLDAWVSLAEAHLSLSSSEFAESVQDQSVTDFLISYAKHNALLPFSNSAGNRQAKALRKVSYLLARRLLETSKPPPALLEWEFLANLSKISGRNNAKSLLANMWKQHGEKLEKFLGAAKEDLTKVLDQGVRGDPKALEARLKRLTHLLHASPETAAFFMLGSDFLDGLVSCYKLMNPPLRKVILSTTYLCLIGLSEGEKPNYSLLADQLYALKDAAEAHKAGPTSSEDSLVAEFVSETPIVKQLRERFETNGPGLGRVRSVLETLESFRKPGSGRPKRLVQRKPNKGKTVADLDDSSYDSEEELIGSNQYGHGILPTIHAAQMSLISQIQDLFPDLGSGFILKLLNEYDDNAELATQHLLEESLPPHLQDADRTEELAPTQQSTTDHAPGLEPHATPPLPPQRRNMYDDDELDQLAVDTSRLHFGRKNPDKTADDILNDRSTAPNKAAILSALAAFDSDDDERDDTYDTADVGGTVDNATPGNNPEEAGADTRDANEEALFRAYKMTPKLFERDAKTRRSKPRAALKVESGMTDEAIEGWAIILSRDQRMMRRLEAKYSAFDGAQRELAPTAYRASPAGSGAEESDMDGGNRGRGGYRGRGRGGRGRGGVRGGSVAGPSGDKGTEVARNRKEANKGSRANHNRRDQRAKKMARGGFPG